MRVHLHVPPPPLSRFVHYMWFREGAAPPHALERIVPSGTTELVIALHDRPLRMADRDGAGLDRAAAPLTVAAMAKETGLSTRRFIELFSREVGLTPRLFARVRRLQAVLRRLEDLTPTTYLARRGSALNHVVLPAAG
jgi:AraC-like DNA-binding protein